MIESPLVIRCRAVKAGRLAGRTGEGARISPGAVRIASLAIDRFCPAAWTGISSAMVDRAVDIGSDALDLYLFAAWTSDRASMREGSVTIRRCAVVRGCCSVGSGYGARIDNGLRTGWQA